VSALQDALAQPQNRDVLDAARALIDRVVVCPPQTDRDPPGIEVNRELIKSLKAAGIGINDNDEQQSGDVGAALTLLVHPVSEGSGARPLAGFDGAAPLALPASSHASKPMLARCFGWVDAGAGGGERDVGGFLDGGEAGVGAHAQGGHRDEGDEEHAH